MFIHVLISLSEGRKQCEKRINCWLPAVSPFPTIFFIKASSSGLLNPGIVWLKAQLIIAVFSVFRYMWYWILSKGGNLCNRVWKSTSFLRMHGKQT